MFLIFRPEGQGEQTFEFRPGRVRLSDAAMLERQYAKMAGLPKNYDNFKDDIAAGNAVALRVLLHHLLRLQHPTIRIEDVDPYDDELEVQLSRSELQARRDQVAETKISMPGVDKEEALAYLDEQIAKAPDSEDPGKAPTGATTVSAPEPSPTSGTTTTLP